MWTCDIIEAMQKLEEKFGEVVCMDRCYCTAYGEIVIHLTTEKYVYDRAAKEWKLIDITG